MRIILFCLFGILSIWPLNAQDKKMLVQSKLPLADALELMKKVAVSKGYSINSYKKAEGMIELRKTFADPVMHTVSVWLRFIAEDNCCYIEARKTSSCKKTIMLRDPLDELADQFWQAEVLSRVGRNLFSPDGSSSIKAKTL